MIQIAAFAQFSHQALNKFPLLAAFHQFEHKSEWVEIFDRLGEYGLQIASLFLGKIAEEP